MILLTVAGILLVVAFLMSVLSLKKDLTKPREIQHAQEDLAREKILYSRS